MNKTPCRSPGHPESNQTEQVSENINNEKSKSCEKSIIVEADDGKYIKRNDNSSSDIIESVPAKPGASKADEGKNVEGDCQTNPPEDTSDKGVHAMDTDSGSEAGADKLVIDLEKPISPGQVHTKTIQEKKSVKKSDKGSKSTAEASSAGGKTWAKISVVEATPVNSGVKSSKRPRSTDLVSLSKKARQEHSKSTDESQPVEIDSDVSVGDEVIDMVAVKEPKQDAAKSALKTSSEKIPLQRRASTASSSGRPGSVPMETGTESPFQIDTSTIDFTKYMKKVSSEICSIWFLTMFDTLENLVLIVNSPIECIYC